MDRDNHSSVLLPYYLPLENIETIGNLNDVTTFRIPPYCLTKPKECVQEINLPMPSDKLYYIDFNIE